MEKDSSLSHTDTSTRIFQKVFLRCSMRCLDDPASWHFEGRMLVFVWQKMCARKSL